MRKAICLALTLLLIQNTQAQWNTNTAVNLEVAGLPSADMKSLTTSTGKTWIAFYHLNGSNYDMRAQLLDAGGNKLLGPDGMLVSNKPSGSATFVFNICKDASDNLVIAFQDQRNGGSGYSAVAYKIGQDGSQLWGNDGIVLGDGLAPNPGLITNGDVVIAWNESASNTLALQKISNAGVAAWATPILVRVGTTATTAGQVVPNLNGDFNLIFQKRSFGISTTLYSQRFASTGATVWDNPVQICTETTASVRYYSVVSENDTTYCGYYSSAGSRFNSYLQRINPDGAIPWGPNGSNFNTSTGGADPYQQTTNIALKPGSPYVWSLCTFSNTNQNQYGVYVQKFLKADGSRVFGPGAKVVYAISANFDTQAGNVSLINDEPMFMTYDVNYKLYATRLNAAGDFAWTPNRIEMSSTTAGGSTPKGRFGFTGLSNTQAVAVWYENRGEYRSYAQNITPGGLFAVRVATQGAVPATITAAGGTLQMTASVFPLTASQAVTWSIVPGTGTASINSSGLVTATTNGTVWAKATSVQDVTVSDSLQVTISNQSVVPITSLTVTTQGAVPAVITTNGGSLQMVATVLPANAVQTVSWSIVPVTGTATINGTGLVTAQTNGTVWARAISTADATKKDSVLITISNQTIPVTGLVVSTQGAVPAVITVNAGTLQMVATITPANASNTAVTWSIVPVSGTASINGTGLVTAQTNGTVWAKAVSQADATKKDSMLITISNQTIPVTGLTVSTQGAVPAVINTNAGTLQMVATITPANASNQAVTWSIVPVSGTASINGTGLVTAQTNGTVWAKAVSQADGTKKDSMLITISNQTIAVTSVVVSTLNAVPATITTNGGTLQMVVTITPANASNTAVTWSIVPVSGAATISATGLVTAQSNGTVYAKAVSVSNPSAKDSMLVTISNQVVTAVGPVPTAGTLVQLSPNPSGGVFYLKATKNHPAFTLQIADASGRVVYEKALPLNALHNGVSVDARRLPAGYYILRFSGTSFINLKWVRQ